MLLRTPNERAEMAALLLKERTANRPKYFTESRLVFLCRESRLSSLQLLRYGIIKSEGFVDMMHDSKNAMTVEIFSIVDRDDYKRENVFGLETEQMYHYDRTHHLTKSDIENENR